MPVQMDPETRKRYFTILDNAKDMTIATLREDGFPQATVVSFVHDGEKIYFSCAAASQKAANIARDDRISVTITPPYETWEDIRGLSLGGRARLITDETEITHVRELVDARFPQVVDFMKALSVEETAYFRLEPEVISILDYGRGFGHAELHLAPSASGSA